MDTNKEKNWFSNFLKTNESQNIFKNRKNEKIQGLKEKKVNSKPGEKKI